MIKKIWGHTIIGSIVNILANQNAETCYHMVQSVSLK